MSRRIRLAAIAIGLTALAGCGTHVDGTALPGEIDVRTLDVGNYPVNPLETRYHYYPDLFSGAVLAQMRLDGQVVTGPEIDPGQKYGTGSNGFDKAEDAAHILAKVSQPVLEADHMLFGFATGSADKPRDQNGDLAAGSAHTLTVVMQFPDAATATKAAAELEDVDFQVAADLNQRVPLAKYPDAHSHWRPGIATLGSFLAHDSYVVNTMVGVKDPDLASLTDLTQKIYDAQLPLLDALPPLDREGMLRLKWDPDGMLRQVLNPNGFGIPDYDSEFVSGERGFLHRVNDQSRWRQLVSDGGVDRFALSGSAFEGPSLLFRARDPEAARRFAAESLGTAFPGAVDAPPKVPDTQCGEGKSDTLNDKKRYRCAIAYRRFVATVDSDQLSDVYQRAAAQYALMANSTW
ncbi:hypothetical protein VMT65_18110 [Nocardia sp. CDC153]|uniref:DUF7373 family lipoprotein n=1 Tax=Nocardia sp. CDC153 TaxID=3112167 RepID=UPI002DBF836E|nr:hypothetical protein [Nocardia sp. CDC153]MEC3954961.1 hypothetical protein [Nocardia sp. CDC153]